MAVLVEARPEYTDETELRQEARRLTLFIRSAVGITTKVQIRPHGTIERSQGKAKRVIDKRPKE